MWTLNTEGVRNQKHTQKVDCHYFVKVESRPKAISSSPCPARSYIPPRLIKFGHGRKALMGIQGMTAPMPPAILKWSNSFVVKLFTDRISGWEDVYFSLNSELRVIARMVLTLTYRPLPSHKSQSGHSTCFFGCVVDASFSSDVDQSICREGTWQVLCVAAFGITNAWHWSMPVEAVVAIRKSPNGIEFFIVNSTLMTGGVGR